jgi:hypothetical protein
VHPTVSGQISPLVAGVVERAPASAHGMAGGEGGHSQKSLPGFRADAQLGDELLRHSAIWEDSNAGALDEKGKGPGIYGMKSFVRKLNTIWPR